MLQENDEDRGDDYFLTLEIDYWQNINAKELSAQTTYYDSLALFKFKPKA